MTSPFDYLFAAVAGFFTGIFTLIIAFLVGKFSSGYVPLLLLGIPLLWIFGIWLGRFLGRHAHPGFIRFSKFAAVGFLSAAIDFAILNTVSVLTGVTAGVVLGWVNVPGFIVGILNAYIWNKLWVFHDHRGFALKPSSSLLRSPSLVAVSSVDTAPAGTQARLEAERFVNAKHREDKIEYSLVKHLTHTFSDLPRFLVVTCVGLLLNSAIVVGVTTFIPSPMSDIAWLNTAKVIASAMVMLWNFFGYKFFAFSKRTGL